MVCDHVVRPTEFTAQISEYLCCPASLCSVQGAAPLPEVNELMETILSQPNVKQAIQSAIQNHEKEELPIGPISSEYHTN